MPQTQAEWQDFAATTAHKAQQLADKVDAGQRTIDEQTEQIKRMASAMSTVQQQLAEAKAAAFDPMATMAHQIASCASGSSIPTAKSF